MDVLIAGVIWLGILLGVFLAGRAVFLWYARIDDAIRRLDELNSRVAVLEDIRAILLRIEQGQTSASAESSAEMPLPPRAYARPFSNAD